jgi:hypothetical protein
VSFFRYAKTAGKDTRNSWLEFTKQYFLKRRVLVAVMLLVDASIPPQRMDLECANWLAEALVSLQGMRLQHDTEWAQEQGGSGCVWVQRGEGRSLAEAAECSLSLP